MKFLSNAKTSIGKTAKRGMLKVSKHSPEILLACGIVTFIGTIVVSNRQTLKCDEIIERHERTLRNIEDSLEIASESEDESYSEEEAKKDKELSLLHTSLDFAKLYAPAFALGGISIVCFCASYGIMRKRNIAIGMAYGVLEQAFNEYRGRVREELGEDSDQYFRYGYKKVKKAKVLAQNENGDDVVELQDVDAVPWDEETDFMPTSSFIFAPETSKAWQRNELLNDLTITTARNTAQMDFDLNGILFLNDVLDKLGIKKVPWGQRIGWAKGHGDPYVDFRLKRVYRKLPLDPILNPYAAEYECIYMFDFNTCGEVWQYI